MRMTGTPHDSARIPRGCKQMLRESSGMETGIDVLQRDVKEMWIKDVFYCNAAIDVSLVTKKRSCRQFFESCFQDNAK